MGLVTLTFDHLTLKLVCESHLRWGTFLPNLSNIGLWVLELFAIYAMDGQTGGRTDGQIQRLLSLPYGGGGIINLVRYEVILRGVYSDTTQLTQLNSICQSCFCL